MIVSIQVILLLLAPLFSASVTLNGRFMPMTKTNKNLWYTKYGPAPSISYKRNTQALTRQGKSYDNNPAPAPSEDQKLVDLHKGEFCVDVSAFGPVTYDKKAVKVCDTTFVKQCEDRSEQVITTFYVLVRITVLKYFLISLKLTSNVFGLGLR